MAVSYEQARAACVAHYAKRVMDAEYWNRVLPTAPAEVFRIYRIIQKQNEDRKRVVIKEEIVCGMKIRRTELIDDADPATSQ
jgi:hypothetical protein